MALAQSQEDDTDRMVSRAAANDSKMIIGVIGDESSDKSSICATLSVPKHVKYQYFIRKNKYIGTRIGEKNAIIVDIECAQKYHSNAINAIADCDVIIYVIPWTGYDDEESERLMRRYLEIAHIFRVKHFIVAITKIDCDATPFITEKIFQRATNRVKDIMKKTNIEKYDILPVAEENEDIEFITNCPSMKWYDGPTLKEILSAIKPSREYKENPFLLTVTHFYQNIGVIVGKVRRGMVSVGERITVFPSGIKGQIESIQRHSESVDSAVCGDHVGIKLKMQNGIKMNIKRGDIIRIDKNPDQSEAVGDVAFRFNATIYVQRFRTSKAMMKSIPRILVESTVNNTVGEDGNEGEYIGVVRWNFVRAGGTVTIVQNENIFKMMYLKRMSPTTNEEAVDVARTGDVIRFRVLSEAEFQNNPKCRESFQGSQKNHETGKSPVFFALLARVLMHEKERWSYPEILVQSKVSDDDQHLFENVGVVTYGDIKVGDTVQPCTSETYVASGKIKWIRKVMNSTDDEEVEEAKCGDRIRFQVMLSRYINSNSVSKEFEYPFRLKPGMQLKAPDKEDTPFWRLYPNTFGRNRKRPLRFKMFIGNGTAKCHIYSIKWRQNADGKWIENSENLEQGDTAEVVMELHTPIHVTPYNEYPEFGAFAMVPVETKKITKSFVIGKVNKIVNMSALRSIYTIFGNVNKATIRSRKSIQFLDIHWNRRLLRNTRKFLDSQIKSTTRCDCADLLRAPRYDTSRMGTVSMDATIDHHDFDQLKICTVHTNGEQIYALRCSCASGGLRYPYFVLYYCNQISKMLKKVIPIEVVEIIEAYSHHNRQALRSNDWNKWTVIPELSERNICKMVNLTYFRGWGYGKTTMRFYLEDNGTLWKAENDNKTEIMQFFSKNKIVVKDIAVGKGYEVNKGTVCWNIYYHCLVVDDHHNVYQFGYWGETPNVDNPRIIHFPLPKNERVQRCVALKCGLRHVYVCLRVEGHDEGGCEYYLDRHFMWGYSKGNQCLTFDGREAVWTPFCINDTVRTHYGGEIDSVFVDIENDTTHIVVKHCYRGAS